MIVLACHIPYVFFAGKEGLCILIDELDRKSISTALWAKYQDLEEPPNPSIKIPLDASSHDMRKSYTELVLSRSVTGRMSEIDAEKMVKQEIQASAVKVK